MKGFQDIVEKVTNKLDALSLREQVLVMLTGLVAIVMIIHETSIMSSMNKIKINQAQTLRLQTEDLVYKQKIKYLERSGPNQYKELKKQNTNLDKQLQDLSLSLVKSDATPKILTGVLSNFKELELIALKSLPAKKYGQDDSLLKQSYKLHFVGEFPDMIKYLYRLKKEVPLVFWEDFEYDTQEFPKASIKLTLFSLDYIGKNKLLLPMRSQ